MKDKYASLKLDTQLCFPLYACSKEVVRKYKPHLDKLDLTYTQYITMMVMWEEEQINVKDLGKRLFLDSGTLTPVLKTLEKKGYVKRTRSKDDERVLNVSVTEQGFELRERALEVPKQMQGCITMSMEDTLALYKLLHKFLDSIQ